MKRIWHESFDLDEFDADYGFSYSAGFLKLYLRNHVVVINLTKNVEEDTDE